jgi:hypothetical protein
MKTFATVLLGAVLAGAPILAIQNPQQQPTSNPDAAKQRTPNPPSPSDGKAQKEADVPGQATDGKSPDAAPQRQTGKKKGKRHKSTASTSTTQQM